MVRKKLFVGNREVKKRYIGSRLVWGELKKINELSSCMYIRSGNDIKLYPIFKHDIKVQNVVKIIFISGGRRVDVENFSNLKYINNKDIQFTTTNELASAINQAGGVGDFQFWGYE